MNLGLPRLKTRMASIRLIASTFCVLLLSCSTTRHTVSPAIEELTRYVLVIEESPGERATHDWQRAEDFDLWQYRHLLGAHGTDGQVVLVSGRQRDCDAENRQCIKMCMSRSLPR